MNNQGLSDMERDDLVGQIYACNIPGVTSTDILHRVSGAVDEWLRRRALAKMARELRAACENVTEDGEVRECSDSMLLAAAEKLDACARMSRIEVTDAMVNRAMAAYGWSGNARETIRQVLDTAING